MNISGTKRLLYLLVTVLFFLGQLMPAYATVTEAGHAPPAARPPPAAPPGRRRAGESWEH